MKKWKVVMKKYLSGGKQATYELEIESDDQSLIPSIAREKLKETGRNHQWCVSSIRPM